MVSYNFHDSSYIEPGAVIGENTQIGYFCHIMSGSKIGSKCTIGDSITVMPDCVIGNNVTIQNQVTIYSAITIEDGVFLGPSMVFTNILNPRSQTNRKNGYLPTLVRKGATIGANATIICGVTLGRYCFIGAGAVVTRDVPDYGLVYGNPARLHGWMCECGVQLKRLKENRYFCPTCGSQYILIEDKMIAGGREIL